MSKIHFSKLLDPQDVPEFYSINCYHPRIAMWMAKHPELLFMILRIKSRFKWKK